MFLELFNANFEVAFEKLSKRPLQTKFKNAPHDLTIFWQAISRKLTPDILISLPIVWV